MLLACSPKAIKLSPHVRGCAVHAFYACFSAERQPKVVELWELRAVWADGPEEKAMLVANFTRPKL